MNEALALQFLLTVVTLFLLMGTSLFLRRFDRSLYYSDSFSNLMKIQLGLTFMSLIGFVYTCDGLKSAMLAGGCLLTVAIPLGLFAKRFGDIYHERRFARIRVTNLVLILGLVGLASNVDAQVSERIKAFDDERILFVSIRSGIGQIYAIRPDGTQLQQLTSDEGVQKTFPRISQDGKTIAYIGIRPKGYDAQGDLYVIRWCNQLTVRVTQTGNVNRNGLAWTSDGKWLIASMNDGPGQNRVVKVNTETGEVVTLTPMGAAGDVGSIHGDRVFFSSGASCYTNLQEVSLAGGRSCNLFDTTLADNTIHVSPDGKWLAWTKQLPGTCGGRGDAFEVALINANGDSGSMRVVAKAPEGAGTFDPVWSPHGDEILFSQTRLPSNLTEQLDRTFIRQTLRIVTVKNGAVRDLDIGGEGASNGDWGNVCLQP